MHKPILLKEMILEMVSSIIETSLKCALKCLGSAIHTILYLILPSNLQFKFIELFDKTFQFEIKFLVVTFSGVFSN